MSGAVKYFLFSLFPSLKTNQIRYYALSFYDAYFSFGMYTGNDPHAVIIFSRQQPPMIPSAFVSNGSGNTITSIHQETFF